MRRSTEEWSGKEAKANIDITLAKAKIASQFEPLIS
jgi:hypothetical protein